MYRVLSLYFPPPKSFRDSKNKIKVILNWPCTVCRAP